MSASLHGWAAVSERLGGISRTTVFQLWKSGQLGSVTIGSRRFSSDEQIAAYIEALQVAS